MSPFAQYAAVATITFAILGFKIVALALLAVTAALLLFGFVTLAPRVTASVPEDEIPVPEEAHKRDG